MNTSITINPYVLVGIRQPRKKHIRTAEAIIAAVCEEFGVTFTQMASNSRKSEVRLPRQIAMYLLCMYSRHTLVNIGIMFGGKDHTTVIHSRETIRNYISYDQDLARRVTTIKMCSGI